jgi:predicted Rossmann fold nucleotide-binding protein DprA/Smf involved in DNA uptake
MINEMVDSEQIFYNALAVSFLSDYKKLTRLITSPENILTDLGLSGKKPEGISPHAGTEEENAILELLRAFGPLSIDEIIETAKLDTSLVVGIVSSLTLAGRIKEESSGYKIC